VLESHDASVPSDLDPASEDFDLFSSLFYLMAHADFQYHEELDKVISRLGLSRTQYRILTVLAKHSPLNVGDLADHALLKRSTCSHALVAMRQKAWINNDVSTEDHRVVEVALTEVGRELIHRVMKSSSKQFHRAVAGLEADALRQLAATLQAIIGNLSRSPIE
jgi:DNA-binding MarR family transcriptional regulator